MTGTHDDSHSHDHDHSHGDAERWEALRRPRIPGNQLDPNVPSTAAMDRKAAINFARVVARNYGRARASIRPDAKTGAHHHGHLESIIFVVKGKARMRWGEHPQFTAEAGPGDFIFVPPYVPHQEINASRDEVLDCVLVRSDGEAVAINLDIEPVEKPETALDRSGAPRSRREEVKRTNAAVARMSRGNAMKLVRYESAGHVATITMDRASAHNARTNALCDELREAWLRFHESDDRVAGLASSEENISRSARMSGISPSTCGTRCLDWASNSTSRSSP